MEAERRIGARGRIESKKVRRKWEPFRRGAYGSTLSHRQPQVLGDTPSLVNLRLRARNTAAIKNRKIADFKAISPVAELTVLPVAIKRTHTAVV